MCRESILDGAMERCLRGLVAIVCLLSSSTSFVVLLTPKKVNDSYCLFLYIFCILAFIETMVDYGYGGVLFSLFLELEVVASTFVTILYCFGS